VKAAGIDEIRVGTVRALPGQQQFGFLNVAETCDGAPVRIPLAIVQGTAPGPVLWLQAGVHGTEYVGTGAIQRVLRELDPSDLRGTLVCVPMVNILAFRSGSRSALQDGVDMNRVYPGKPLDRAMHVCAHTEIVVHRLFTELSRLAHFVVDCHDGGFFMQMAPFAQYIGGKDGCEGRSQALARACGLRLVWCLDEAEATAKTPGCLMHAAVRVGIPAIMIEVGGQGRLAESDVATAHRALLNVLRHIGMLEGRAIIPEEQHHISRGHRLRSQTGGTVWCAVEPLTHVRRGQVIQVITDLFGCEKERLVAPVDGVVIGLRTLGMVNSGEYCSSIGELSHE